jgi:hypothetical protein
VNWADRALLATLLCVISNARQQGPRLPRRLYALIVIETLIGNLS